MGKQRSMYQHWWVRLSMFAAVVGVAMLTMALNNCWCAHDQWMIRLALLSLVGISFAVELVWGRWPAWVFSVSVAGPVGWLIFTDNGPIAALLLLLMIAWTVYTGSLRDGLLASGLAVVAILGYVHFDSPDRWLPWVAGIGATALMMRLFVVQQSLVQQLRAAQADLAQNAVAAERRRIAGEIHDVAAHALALTVLHLTGVRLRVQREGGSATLVESLAEAERLGRQSLDDIRRTVGLLQDEAPGIAPPLPGADDVGALIEQYRAGGLAVAFDLHGQPATVAPATGLAVYRIVQESLANVVKHAPGVDVHILLEVGSDVKLGIRNPLNGSARSDAGSGHGLSGMRERARLLRGSLRAGPDGESWLVECSIPGDTRA